MTLDSFLARARYLALALPLFALVSTVQGGCITGTSRYGYGTSDSASTDCTTYGSYGSYGGYVSYTNCYGAP
jgi:hypothetical protein